MGTHTYARLDISQEAYKEIKDKLREAGYDHAFMPDGVIDMHGIGLAAPYEGSKENVIAHFKEKLNEAVDEIAAKNGVTREELLSHARKLLEEGERNRLRTELKQENTEDQ